MGVSPISPSSSPCRRRRQAKRKKRGFSGTPRTPAKGRALCNPAYLSSIGRRRRIRQTKFDKVLWRLAHLSPNDKTIYLKGMERLLKRDRSKDPGKFAKNTNGPLPT